MIFKSPKHALAPSRAKCSLVAPSLALAAVLLGCGEQVIVGREAATQPPAAAPIDAGSYGAPPPPSVDSGSEDTDSDGDDDDDDDESDGDDEALDDDETNTDERN